MQHLQETGGGLAIMVKQALQTSHPPSCPHSVSPRLCGCCIFHSPYTLPSSVSCKSFACHSYENTGGVGVFFPFWNSPLSMSAPIIMSPWVRPPRPSEAASAALSSFCHTEPSHAPTAHPRSHPHLRGLRPLRPLRPLPQRVSHLPALESRSRFAPRPHPPDDPGRV